MAALAAKLKNRKRSDAKTARARSPQGQPDWWLLVSVLLLLAVGIIMVFSSSQYFAQYEPYNDTYYFLKSQLKNAAVGAVAMFLAYKVNYRLFNRASYAAFVVLLVLLLFMVVSTRIETIGGAQRWLTVFGFSFQPSELAKIIMPMALARWATANQNKLSDFKQGFLPAMSVIALVAGLIFLERDLSSAVVVAVTGVIVIFCAGARFAHFLLVGAAGVAAVAAAIIFEPYRMDRIRAWLDPWAFAQDEGWQTVQSMMAIGSGGLTGVGLGSGGSKWYYLPERHTDFIFSVLSEELGFIGGLVVILIIGFIVWRGVMVAIKAPTTYTTLLSIGLIGSLGVQSIVNLGVCTGLLPVTGVTLPFMSYGGTSLVVSMTMIGILLNISKNSNRT